MIKSVYADELPVVYDPPKPDKVLFIEDDLYRADTFSFGSIIGQITNKGSNGYAILPILEEKYGVNSKEYKLTESRLKQCCKAQSAQIDKAKIGREVKGIPSNWIENQIVCDGDDEKTILEKELYNRILLTKYPYFFKYLYNNAKKKYNSFVDKYEIICHQKFKMSLSKLKSLPRKTVEQKNFLNGFYEYMPLTFSDSSMNLVCRYLEEINFNLRQTISKPCSKNTYELYKNKFVSYDDNTYNAIVLAIKKHKKIISEALSAKTRLDWDNSKNNNNTYLADNYVLEKNLLEINSNVDVVLNCLVDYFYGENPSANKDFLWDTYGVYIVKNLKQNTDTTPLFPVLNEGGEIKYLGKHYSLRGVVL